MRQILLFASVMICLSCSHATPDGYSYWDEYFLEGLVEADIISFTKGASVSCKHADGTPCQPRILFCFNQRNHRSENNLSSPEFKKSLGDGGGWYLHSDTRSISVATINRFKKVSMTSGQRFNDIPAGQPLDNVVSLFGASAYPELLQKRGGFMDQANLPYGEKEKETNSGWLNGDYYWFAKHLSELEEEDLFLLDHYFYIVFDEYPDIHMQTLTLTFTDSDGVELSVTGTFTFPEDDGL